MKSALQTLGFFLLFFFVFLICPSSCAGTRTYDAGAFTKRDYDAAISGRIDTLEVSGRAINRPCAAEDEIRFSFCFDSPESLEGMMISVTADGEVFISLDGEMSRCVDDSPLAGAFYPLFEMIGNVEVTRTRDGGITAYARDERADLQYSFVSGEELPFRVSGRYLERSIDLTVREISDNDK